MVKIKNNIPITISITLARRLRHFAIKTYFLLLKTEQIGDKMGYPGDIGN